MLNVRLAGDQLYGKLLFTWLSLVVSMVVSFCAVLFPTRCLGWYLELNWVSFWGFSFLPIYLTLISDSFLNTFPNNTQSSFTVRLYHPIDIEKENWEVALVESSTPSRVNNISENNNFFFLSFLDQTVLNAEVIGRTKELCTSGEGCHEYKLFLPEGNYNSPQHLVDEMQSVIDTKHGSLLKKNKCIN